MVTFNGADHVREQIDSILSQVPLPDQLVIGDDGSSDGTLLQIQDLVKDAQIDVEFVGGDHVGLRRNVQRTLEACGGDIIALADQDDVWLPGKVAAIREALSAGGVTLWFSDADLIDESGRLMGERLWERATVTSESLAEIGSRDVLRRLLVGGTVTGATMAFSASLKPLILPLPDELEADDRLYLHDGWIAVLAWLMGSAVADPEPRIRYRRHPRQFTAMDEPDVQAASDDGGTPASSAQPALVEPPRLVSRHQLVREHARARLVLERIRATDSLTACRPGDVRSLVELEAFLRVRTMPSGASRVGSIVRQFALGRYARYARGWRTAGADLFLSRA